jgi:hypothetical protein
MDIRLGSDPNAPTVLATPARNRYFYGKLMDVPHFDLEQSYNNAKRWLLNRVVSGSGIVCGLAVSATSDGTGVTVSPGMAIDSWGREIVVSMPTHPINPFAITDAFGNPLGTISGPATVTLCLSYHECAVEPTPVLVPTCDTGDCAAGTIAERYRVVVMQGQVPNVPLMCAFPEIFGSGSESFYGVPDLRPALTQWVTQNCPDPSGEQCVMIAQISLPAQGPITQQVIDQSSCQFVANNQLLLQLILCLAERVEQCCGQMGPLPTPTPLPAAIPAPAGTSPAAASNPGPTPVPTPTPSPVATPTFRVTAVDFLDQSGKVVQKLASPNVPIGITARANVRSIRVAFNQPARVSSVTTEQAGGNPALASFLVQRAAPLAMIPGAIQALGPATIEFTLASEVSFVKGEYRATLFGDVDLKKLRPAITSTSGARLDGEPLALPSGNGVEGGNFVFQFEVA